MFRTPERQECGAPILFKSYMWTRGIPLTGESQARSPSGKGTGQEDPRRG